MGETTQTWSRPHTCRPLSPASIGGGGCAPTICSPQAGHGRKESKKAAVRGSRGCMSRRRSSSTSCPSSATLLSTQEAGREWGQGRLSACVGGRRRGAGDRAGHVANRARDVFEKKTREAPRRPSHPRNHLQDKRLRNCARCRDSGRSSNSSSHANREVNEDDGVRVGGRQR